MTQRPSHVIRSSELRAKRGKTRASGRGETEDIKARLVKAETQAFRNLRGDRASLESLAGIEGDLSSLAADVDPILDWAALLSFLTVPDRVAIDYPLEITNSPAAPVGLLIVDGNLQVDSGNAVIVGELEANSMNMLGTALFPNGGSWGSTGFIAAVQSGASVARFNRTTNDGAVVTISQDGTLEGQISVSGTTVSYLGGHLSRFSQWGAGHEPTTPPPRGTVLSNLDEKAVWIAERWIDHPQDEESVKARAVSGVQRHEPYKGDLKPGDRYLDADGKERRIVQEANEQLNRVKVSDVDADPDFAGIFDVIDEDGDVIVAGRGEFLARVGSTVTVSRGDMLVSAGDGTARPVSDAEPITLALLKAVIGKVLTAEPTVTYPDGSYLVPVML